MPLLIIASVGITILLLGLVSRRLLGVPVGWIRTIAVSLLISTSGGALLRSIGESLGVLTGAGDIDTSNPVLSGGVLLLLLAWSVALGLGILVILGPAPPQPALCPHRRARRQARPGRLPVQPGSLRPGR